ncbi:glycoside hydrolase family 95-like protein [Asanoa sp. NPDC050611]|uniref:glycoside hydrolase family 95-like protein n=1 Tax=Asanoa sp. NPDC050611 TaxID=3157098 RepID=UPI0033DFC7A4
MPADWPAGRLTGAVARPGIVVDVEWDAGHALVAARLSADRPTTIAVRWGTASVYIELAGDPVWVSADGDGRLVVLPGSAILE